MLEGQQVDICLLVHCLTDGSAAQPRTHRELFIPVSDLDGLLAELTASGFHFQLPGAQKVDGRKHCAVTFDDGYANNALFLPLAEKHRIPFVLFVSSLNIEEQLPFIWDVKTLSGGPRWRHWSADHRSEYKGLDNRLVRDLMADENHRPFTLAELDTFASSEWTYLGLHTHTHQPLVGRFLARAERELTENARFLARFPRVLTRDLALPCGLYTYLTNRHLLARFVDRVYTCDGGRATAGATVVPRISLINPELGGSLISQVERGMGVRARFRRKLSNVRYSNRFLHRF